MPVTMPSKFLRYEAPCLTQRHSCGRVSRPHVFSSRRLRFLHPLAQNAGFPAILSRILFARSVAYHAECASPCSPTIARGFNPESAASAGLQRPSNSRYSRAPAPMDSSRGEQRSPTRPRGCTSTPHFLHQPKWWGPWGWVLAPRHPSSP